MRRRVLELEIRQAELESQNERLSQGRDDLEKKLAKYTELYGLALSELGARRESEEALLQRERFTCGVLDSLNANICVVDAKGRIVLTNDSWDTFARENNASARTCSRGADYLDACRAICREEQGDIEETALGLRAVIDGAKPGFVKEYPCHSPETGRWFACNAASFRFSGERFAVISHADVTERRRAEAQLHASEERLRLFVEYAPVALAMFDRDMCYLLASNRWLIDYGLGERDLRGLAHYEVFPEISERWKKAHRRGLSGEILRGTDDRFERGDGSVQWVQWEVRPWYDTGGEVGGIVIFAEDVSEYKKSQNDLIESEGRFRTLFEQSAAGAALVDIRSRKFARVNRKFSEILGYSQHELQSLDLIAITYPGDQQGNYHKYARLKSGGIQEFNLETRYLHRDGRVVWADTSVSKMSIENGEAEFFIVVIRDITKRKQARETLRRNEERLRRTVRAGRIGLYEWNTNRYSSPFWSPETYALLGLEPGSPAGNEQWLECVHPDDRRQATHLLPELNEKSGAWQQGVFRLDEYRVLHADGSVHWLEAMTSFELDGGDFVMRGAVRDISERKQVEEALRESKRFHAETEKIGKVGGWELDIETRDLSWTEEVYRIHEVDPDFAPTMKKAINFYAPASRPVMEKLVRRAVEQGEPFDVDLEIITARGNLRSVNAIGKVDAGRRKIFGFFQDISERRQVADALKCSEEHLSELNQKLRDLGEHLQKVQEQERLSLARDIHDDIGQHLTALRHDLEWFERRVPADKLDQHARIVEMRGSIGQLMSSVQRIAAGLRPPLLDHMGLSAAIDWQVTEFSKRSGIEAYTMLNDEIDSLDQQRSTAVMRIVQEGLTNIVRHTKASEVSVSLCKKDQIMILEISDNGCGITAEQIASSDAYGLIGMQERARICKGNLDINATPGSGTTLQLSIPLTMGEQTA